jgi:hypothetical protein
MARRVCLPRVATPEARAAYFVAIIREQLHEDLFSTLGRPLDVVPASRRNRFDCFSRCPYDLAQRSCRFYGQLKLLLRHGGYTQRSLVKLSLDWSVERAR